MKAIIFSYILVFFLSYDLFAQHNFVGDSLSFSGKFQAGISSQAGATGTGMPVNFLYKFYRGGRLNDDYLSSVESKLKESNVLGGSGRNRIFLAYSMDSVLFKKVGLSLGFSFEEHWNASAMFSNDVFKLLFFGNDQSEDFNAKLNPTWFRLFNYRQYSFEGVFRKITKINSHYFQFSLNYLQGKQFSQIDIIRGDFFTSQYGTRIDADIKGSYYQSDTSRAGIKRFDKGNGSGAGFSFLYTLQGKKTTIFLGVRDAGFIDWNSNTLRLSADTSIHLKGYQVFSLKDISDSLFSLSVDSLRNIAPNSRFKKYRMVLPAKIFFESHHSLRNPLYRMIAGVRYIADPVYLPLFYSGFYFTKCLGGVLRTTLGYGGYAKINLSLEYQRKFFKDFSISAAINQAEGVFNPANPKGFSGFIGIRYH